MISADVMRRALAGLLVGVLTAALSSACRKPPVDALQLDGNKLTVTNTTDAEWRDLEIWLNTYYRATAPSLVAHGRLDTTLDKFVSGYAQRFDFHHAQVRSLHLSAKRPDGTPIAIDFKFRESGLAGALGEKR
jgi:hypothetical protein